jgi:arylformamidase
MHIYDVSLPISGQLPIWPGDPHPSFERIMRMEDGADCNVSQITMSVHLGTHVDAPYHFLGGGSDTIESLALNSLIGRAYVLQLGEDVDLISADVLEKAQIPPRTRRLLFKTRNSRLWQRGDFEFKEDFVALSPDGAQYLVARDLRVVGVDYLSVAPFISQIDTHEILLKAGMVVIEGLNLAEVSQGRYSLYCLPLNIIGADGAPARVILIGV